MFSGFASARGIILMSKIKCNVHDARQVSKIRRGVLCEKDCVAFRFVLLLYKAVPTGLGVSLLKLVFYHKVVPVGLHCGTSTRQENQFPYQ